jgi:kynureninase
VSAAPTDRRAAEALDAADPLGGFRDRFVIADDGSAYLDGNSLGRLPKATAMRLRQVVDDEWGVGLVRSWESWIDLPERVGAAIAPLIGAAGDEVVVADSTTVCLHALVDAACAARPTASTIVVSPDDFPTDRYVVEGVAAARGLAVAGDPSHPPRGTVVVVVSAVDFRTGAVADLGALAEAAHAAGALLLADLSHAVGAVPVDVEGAGVDLAVGCTYKHLLAGPGAPAFLYVRRSHQPDLQRPQWGWFAQREQFAMSASFDRRPGIGGFLAGTPPILGLVAVEEGVRIVAEAGIDRIRAKSIALGELAAALVEERLVPLGCGFGSPPLAADRGAHLAVTHPEAVAVGAAARAAGVVPDVRPPDVLRLGLSPLTTSFVEVWDGIDRLTRVIAAGAWDAPQSRVT